MGSFQDLKKTTLASVPQDQAFRVCRGDVITNVHDLANCIEHLTEGQFRHHVGADGSHNHFADWIRSVLKNPGLASDLSYPANLKDQKHYVRTIRDHVGWLQSV